MVGALPGVVEREVLFDHPPAEHVSHDRHDDAVRVVGEPGDDIGKTLTERSDDAQMHVLRVGRISGRALQEAELRIDRHDFIINALRVVDAPAANADNQRLAELRDLFDQRDVFQIAGRDFVERHVELREKIGAREIERRGEKIQPQFLRELLQFHILLFPKLEELAVLAISRAEAVRIFIRHVESLACVERTVVALLQFHRVAAGVLGRAEKRDGLRHFALMVVADFGDDVAVAVVADGEIADGEGAGRHGLVACIGW